MISINKTIKWCRIFKLKNKTTLINEMESGIGGESGIDEIGFKIRIKL